MGYIGIVFFIIIAIAVFASWIKNLSPGDRSSLQEKLNRGLAQLLGEQNNSVDTSDVKIYDENGNVINFQNNAVTNNNKEQQDVVIYDEDGNVMSAASPLPVHEEPAPVKKLTKEAVSEIDEAEEHASMYRDFIRSNGGSAIVVQEILGKPAALR